MSKIIDVDVQKLHDNINTQDAETISEIVNEALGKLGVANDNLISWSWNIEVLAEVKEMKK